MSLMIVSTTNLGSTGTHTPLKKSYKKNVKRSLINPGCMLAMYRRSLARAISRPVRWADAQSSLTVIATMKFKSRLTAVYIAAQHYAGTNQETLLFSLASTMGGHTETLENW